MAQPLREPASYADLVNVPGPAVVELVHGELTVLPRPSIRHQHVMKRLSNRLRPFDDPEGDEPGGWVVLTEPELWLGDPDPTDLVLVPDLAGWRTERLPALPDTIGVAVVPDWVCEIASPSTRRRDRLQKMDLYAASGVAHLWLVDPEDRFVEVWRLEGGRWSRIQRFCDEDVMRAEPFEHVAIHLGSWWAART